MRDDYTAPEIIFALIAVCCIFAVMCGTKPQEEQFVPCTVERSGTVFQDTLIFRAPEYVKIIFDKNGKGPVPIMQKPDL